jgi:hypothetical protein
MHGLCLVLCGFAMPAATVMPLACLAGLVQVVARMTEEAHIDAAKQQQRWRGWYNEQVSPEYRHCVRLPLLLLHCIWVALALATGSPKTPSKVAPFSFFSFVLWCCNLT